MSARTSFADRFRAVAAERIGRVVAALDAGDPDEARREIHGLKGEARVVGFEAIATIAHALESRLADGAGRADLDAGIALIDRGLALSPEAEPDGMAAFLAPHVSVSVAPAASEPLAWVASRATDAFLRVDMEVLGRLTRSVSEVRATERALLALVATLAELFDDDDRADAHRALAAARQLAFDHRQRCDVVTGDLRRLRMVPLAQLFEPFPRAVAQLAAQLGKEVELTVHGADVEVDRQVLDVVTEPLLHLVRNAVDHGIERPDRRRAHGKPPVGHVTLRARAAHGRVEIEIADDGGGVDVDAVRAAVGAEVDGEAALLDALCRHGVSTRSEVSEVSGRGVGLDVVKRRIESVGGRLRLATEPGRGTTFTLSLPTSMVLGTMVCVEVDGARFAFAPHEVECVIDAREGGDARAGHGALVRVADRSLPVHDLGVLTERASAPRPRARLLVLHHADRAIALGVDTFRGTRAVSELRLDPFLHGVPIVRSVAVLESGELAVALDPAELIRRADASTLDTSLDAAPRAVATPAALMGTVLVVDDSELTRDLIVATLREMGLDVVEAIDGASALTRLEAHAVDLVVTDLDMPVMDGFELIRRVRRSPRARLPIVVLSSRGDDADIRRASELGADAYLVKSRLELPHLRRVIRRYVEASA